MKFSDNELMTTLLKHADDHHGMSLESMSHLKIELIWLYTYLEIKGDESTRRGKKPSKEYSQSINTVKRASLLITQYCLKLQQMESTIQELQRQIRYYQLHQPQVEFSKLNLTWDGSQVKYIKDFISKDNF